MQNANQLSTMIWIGFLPSCCSAQWKRTLRDQDWAKQSKLRERDIYLYDE